MVIQVLPARNISVASHLDEQYSLRTQTAWWPRELSAATDPVAASAARPTPCLTVTNSGFTSQVSASDISGRLQHETIRVLWARAAPATSTHNVFPLHERQRAFCQFSQYCLPPYCTFSGSGLRSQVSVPRFPVSHAAEKEGKAFQEAGREERCGNAPTGGDCGPCSAPAGSRRCIISCVVKSCRQREAGLMGSACLCPQVLVYQTCFSPSKQAFKLWSDFNTPQGTAPQCRAATSS